MAAISLIGFMGAGKTTVGTILAKLTRLEFLDLDKILVKRFGLEIPEIFSRHGEPAFRAAESEELAGILFRPKGKILATGGGVVLDPENRRLLKTLSWCVFLNPEADILLRRIRQDSPGRPLADGIPDSELRRKWEKRIPLYFETAHFVTPAGDSPEEVAREILKKYHEVSGS